MQILHGTRKVCRKNENARDRSLWRSLLCLADHWIIDQPIQLGDGASGLPLDARLQLRRGMDIRVASNHASFGCVPQGKLRVTPNLLVPLAVPPLRLRVAPNLASTAGSMMNPRQSLNLALAACAANESSRSTGSCAFLPDPGCSFNLIRPFTAACANGKRSYATALCIVLPSSNCVSKSLQGYQLFGE